MRGGLHKGFKKREDNLPRWCVVHEGISHKRKSWGKGSFKASYRNNMLSYSAQALEEQYLDAWHFTPTTPLPIPHNQLPSLLPTSLSPHNPSSCVPHSSLLTSA